MTAVEYSKARPEKIFILTPFLIAERVSRSLLLFAHRLAPLPRAATIAGILESKTSLNKLVNHQKFADARGD
jgi:hypothetical protein